MRMTNRETNDFIQQVRQNYDALSASYDYFSGSAESRIVLKGLELLKPAPHSRLLDIGCGTGNALVAMKKRFSYACGIYGLDISLGMCLQARRKLHRAFSDNIPPLGCGNALALPFPAGCFNAILMSFTFELFPQTLFTPLLRECRRVLRPNGKLLVVSMARAQEPSLIYRMYLWAHRKYPRLIDCRPLDAAEILAENGFEPVSTETHNLFGLPVNTIMAS
jgi:ubiquinone/menaquinone biosynthesis C-methylase UbiE